MTTTLRIAPLSSPLPPDSRTYPASTPNDPAVPLPVYELMRPRWEKGRALMLGTEAVRNDPAAFLNQYELEEDADFESRAVLATLYPGFSRTILAGVGMLLALPPVFGTDMPPVIKELAMNIDGAGTDWVVFCTPLARNAMVDGFDGILVEYSNPDDPELDRSNASAAAVPGAKLSTDDEKRLGLRPYFKLYKADDIIKPVYQIIGGKLVLVMLILREVIQRVVEPYGVEAVAQFRVYKNRGGKGLITFDLWRETAGSRTQLIKDKVLTITRVPWSPLVAGIEINPGEIVPPLNQLADLNIEHLQVKNGVRSLEELAFVPTIVRVGAAKDEEGEYPPVVLGPKAVIEAPATQGVSTPVYWLSPPTEVLAPAQQTLTDLEGAMAREGGSFLAPDPAGVESAEAKRIKGAAQRATLATVSRATQDCLVLAFDYVGEYLNLKAGGVTMNRDFEQQVMDPAVMTTYIQAVRDAGFPVRVLLEEWKRGGRLSEDTDIDKLEREILSQQAADAKAEEQAAEDAARALVAGKQPGTLPLSRKPPVPPKE